MNAPGAFLRFFAKAVLNAVGGGVAGDFVVEVLPDVARDVWRWWSPGKTEAQLRGELEQLAQLTPAEAQQQAVAVMAEHGSNVPEPILRLVTSLVSRVPATVRASQRRLDDPSGRTLPPSFRLREANDLLPLFPHRPPRFHEGQKPLPGVDWELVEPLGVGGFGEVWKARNPHMGTEAALKFCLDANAARSLRNEVDLLRRVQNEGRHPGIVQLRNTYLSAEPPFLEYEYIAGGDLASIIPRWQTLAPAQRIDWAARLMHHLSGIVGFAHRLRPRGIVHRDLKPANVLVQASAGGSFQAKVADFGIGGVAARYAVAQLQHQSSRGAFLTTALRGSYTPIYASPEQRRGADPDPRDDVFSLGVIWLQLLTDNLMLEAGSDWRDDVSGLGLSDPMLSLMGRCLAKAEKRPADAAELETELAKLLGLAQQQVKVVVPQPEKKVPPPPPDDPAERLLSALSGFDGAHQKAREAMKRYDFAEAVRLLDGVPLEHRNHAEYANACKARERRDFLDPAIKEAAAQQNLFRLRFLLSEALVWMPERPDLVRLRDVVSPRVPKEVSNAIGMRFAFIPPGKFQMGSPDNEAGRLPREGPLHEAEITRPFYMGVFPVTQAEYEAVMGNNPSNFGQSPRSPVEQVTWNDAVEFCSKLSNLPAEKQSGRMYRLPTEAEWEYSCRGGASQRTIYPFGNSITDKHANFNNNLKRTCAVGSYPTNGFGLHDMIGNVWEWCSDWFGEEWYSQSPRQDPQGPAAGSSRVLRGGSWCNGASCCRSACRYSDGPGYRGGDIGFRVVLLPA